MSAQTALKLGHIGKTTLSKETKLELKGDLDDISKEYQKKVVKLQQFYSERKNRNYQMREIRKAITGMEAQMSYLKHKLGMSSIQE